MIAIVRNYKGIGKICQYKVSFEDKSICHFFVAFGVKGRDIMQRTLIDDDMILAHRKDNNVKALIEEYENEGSWINAGAVTSIRKVWG